MNHIRNNNNNNKLYQLTTRNNLQAFHKRQTANTILLFTWNLQEQHEHETVYLQELTYQEDYFNNNPSITSPSELNHSLLSSVIHLLFYQVNHLWGQVWYVIGTCYFNNWLSHQSTHHIFYYSPSSLLSSQFLFLLHSSFVCPSPVGISFTL